MGLRVSLVDVSDAIHHEYESIIDKGDRLEPGENIKIFDKRPISDLFQFNDGDQLSYIIKKLFSYSEEVRTNYFTDECTVLATWTMYNVKILPLVNFLKSYLIKTGQTELCKLWLDNYAGLIKYMDDLKNNDHDKFATYGAYMSSAPSGLISNLTMMFPTKYKLETIMGMDEILVTWEENWEWPAPTYACDWLYCGIVNDEINDLLAKAGFLQTIGGGYNSEWKVFVPDSLGAGKELDKDVVKLWTKIASSVNDSPAKLMAEAYSLLRETDIIISELVGVSPDTNGPNLQGDSSALANWSEIASFINKMAECRVYAKDTNKNFIMPEFFNAIISGLLMEYTIGLDRATIDQYHSEALKAWRGSKVVSDRHYNGDSSNYIGPVSKYSSPYYKKTSDMGSAKLIWFDERYEQWPGIGGDPETGWSMSSVVIQIKPGNQLLPPARYNQICDMVPNYPRHGTRLAAYPVCISSFGDLGDTLRRTTFEECFGGESSAISSALHTISDMDTILSMVNMTMEEIETINNLIDQILKVFDN